VMSPLAAAFSLGWHLSSICRVLPALPWPLADSPKSRTGRELVASPDRHLSVASPFRVHDD
jgi:hypothetical protein